MNGLAASLLPAAVYYPVFAGVIIVWLLVRLLIRRVAGPQFWTRAVLAVERTVLTLFILAMLLLSAAQIALRNLFHTGLDWIDPMTRHLVLWVGFSGAVAATGQLRHLHMDVVRRLLPPEASMWALRLTTAVAAIVSAVLSRAALIYLVEEAGFGSRVFLGIPSWEATCIIFIGFALMSARFATRALYSDAALAETERRSMGEGREKSLAGNDVERNAGDA